MPMLNSTLKERLLLYCQNLMEEKVQSLNLTLQQVTESANNETKSSAGDKHETARAMMQLEQEKLTRQINEALQVQSELLSLHNHTSSQVTKGSLISTNRGFVYIAAPLGKIEFEKNTFIVISDKSPLALKFMGLKQNASIDFNGVNYQLISIQ